MSAGRTLTLGWALVAMVALASFGVQYSPPARR